jgi:uncharacterized protein YndB with AHSA1/START domain
VQCLSSIALPHLLAEWITWRRPKSLFRAREKRKRVVSKPFRKIGLKSQNQASLVAAEISISSASDNTGDIAEQIMSNLRQADLFFSCTSSKMNHKESALGTRDYPREIAGVEIKPAVKVGVTRRLRATPQRVFRAWVDSEAAGKWLFAKAGEIVCAEIDARAGGWFYIVERRNNENVEYVGEYLDVLEPHRLIFMLLGENLERVVVLFNPHEIGCELRLTHETKPELAERTRDDWMKLLDRLAALLAGNSCHAA